MTRVILALSTLLSLIAYGSPRIIGGEALSSADYPEVVEVRINNSFCSGTVVGPQAILTAAHCVPEGAAVQVTAGEKTVSAIAFRSSLYPAQDVDTALLVTLSPLEAKPVSILAEFDEWDVIGSQALLVGFGCETSTGGGHGVLRGGRAKIVEFNEFDIITKGAALCFGDSGSPLMLEHDSGRVVIGTASKGNVKDVSYHHNLSHRTTLEFLSGLAKKHGIEICGISSDCGR